MILTQQSCMSALPVRTGPTHGTRLSQPLYKRTCSSWQQHSPRCRVATRPEDLYDGIGDNSPMTNDVETEYNGPQLARLDISEAGGLGGTSEDVFGELAALLVGFTQQEFEKFREIMIDMEADIVKMIPCSAAMLDLTLEQAVKSTVPAFEQLPSGTRRAVILSGMSTEEVMEVIAYYHDTEKLPETLWGAAVPKNYDRNLGGLIAEMYNDHDWMRQQGNLQG